MRAIYSAGSAEKSHLEVRRAPIPLLGADDVLIKVHAAGINRADILQRQGRYPPPSGVTDILGLEVSGEIVQVGRRVSPALIGQSRCALLAGGGYAEYVAASLVHTLPIPKGMDILTAATLPEVCATVWYNLFMKAKLRKGEAVLIHGGSGGVGSMAIQIATACGAICYGTAGTAEKCSWAEKLGAVKVFNYHEDDVVEALKMYTQGKGVQVVLDMVGGAYIEKNMAVLGQGGRLVNIACMQGGRTDASFAPLLLKNLTWMGSTLRNQSKQVKKHIIKHLMVHVWPLFAAGTLHPMLDKVFSWEMAEEAHAYMEKGLHKGKILLRFV